MLTRNKVITSVLLLFGILIIVNFFANRFFFRLDFTEDDQYTLSVATENILENLDKPLTVTAYFSEDLPPDVAKVKRDFKDLLIEYDNASGGKVVYQFVNPNENQQAEMEAQQAGIQPVMINVRERDQMKQQRAYLGAVLQYGEKKEVIPVIQPGSSMEYDISTKVKKLSLTEKTKIAFLQGNGEPSLNEMGQLNQQLSIMYDVQSVSFSDTAVIPNTYKTLVIVAPSDTVNPAYFNQLDQFLSNGGRILVALNRVEGNLQNATGSSLYTGFSSWLKKYGIEVKDEFIIDVNSGSVMVRQQAGGFMMNTPVQFPYLPIVSKFADHPITEGLESVSFPFVSPVNVNVKDTAMKVVNLALTSERTGLKSPPLQFDIMNQWTEDDFPVSNIPVAVAVEGTINNASTKMVLFGDGDFVVNGSGQNRQRLQEDNVNIMTNAIDWLSDDTGLIALRTKGVSSRPLDPDLEQGTKTFLKYLNFLLPILLILVIGLARYQYRRKLRKKWMSEDYV